MNACRAPLPPRTLPEMGMQQTAAVSGVSVRPITARLAGFRKTIGHGGRGSMAQTRTVTARVPESLEQRARDYAPELAALDLSTLVRVGLAVLAGHDRKEAMAMATVRARPGRPRKDCAA